MTEFLPRPAYDPGLEAAMARRSPLPEMNDETFEVGRARAPDPVEFGTAVREAGVEREDRTIQGAGGALPITLLRPATSAGRLPAMVMLHGGAMVFNNRTGSIPELRVLHWIRRFGLLVVSPEYRLAPEAPAPAGVEDCSATVDWLAANADALGVDAGRILVAGVSGGGGLAAGAALLARDRGGAPLLGQLLICPMLDDRGRTASTRQFSAAGGPVVGLAAESIAWAWNAVLGEGHERRDDIAHSTAPGRAHDLSGLPPTYLDVGSAEPFRDEVVEYASRLWADGVQAELHVWAGAFHGFDLFAPEEPVSVAAHAAREHWLRRILAPS
jgi:acetyl esterase/lipase